MYQTLAISVAGMLGIYEPDLVVCRRAELTDRPDNVPVPADLAKLVVEIVSDSNARTDRVEKLRGYAQASVPLYLLIDRFAKDGQSVTLHSKPSDGHYRHSVTVPFGAKITLPEPFDLVLDTADFTA